MNKKEVLDAISQEFRKSLQDIGATNGDVIKVMFPNKYGEQCGRTKIYYNIDAHNRMEFQIDWWNAPYKPERTEKK